MDHSASHSDSIDAVVFDMDGVLFDTEPLHMKAWRRILAHTDGEYTDDFFKAWVGIPDEDLAAHLDGTMPENAPPKGYLEAKRETYLKILTEELTPFEGLEDILAEWSRRIPLAVATSSQRRDLEHALGITGIGKYFRATVAFGDVTKHKPDPESYAAAARLLGVKPERCAGLDDSPTGVPSAKAAGMVTLGIASTFDGTTLSAADHVFPTTVEACRWLEPRLNG